MLLVEPGHAPPHVTDPFEDWVRLPAGQDEVDVRSAVVAARRDAFDSPTLKAGTLDFREASIALSPTQSALVTCLVERFGEVVLRRELLQWISATHAGSRPNRNVLDLHMARLRRKLEPVGLAIRTVWGTGYVLELADGVALEGQAVG